MAILNAEDPSTRGQNQRQHQDQVSVWMAWLDWAVRFVRPSWEANVTTWNMGPLGYEYSRTQLQELLKEGQAVVMVQEVRFPLGARQRVKNELKHLHPEYHCFLEAGKDPLPPDGEDMDTEAPKSPWCKRGHFAVATFLHRGVFRSAQRREWHVDADTKTLRHMTRGRVLRVEAELHDGQRLQVFNVHQATSGDMQLQQHTWQILTKRIMQGLHQRILLGGDLNANASGLRFGYAAANAEHMKRVDDLLAQFVTNTQGS
jgi:endonuclease/exonuclease/phosphatase family metal-dependent hydrolase